MTFVSVERGLTRRRAVVFEFRSARRWTRAALRRCRCGDCEAEVARFSPRDAERLAAYHARLDRLAAQLKAVGAADAAESRRTVGDRRLARLRRRGEADAAVRPPAARGPAGPGRHLHEERRRLARQLVRMRAAEGRARLGLGGRQLREPVCARGPPTCCCITASARSTASRASGAMRSAAWERSRRRWRPRPSARGVEITVDAPVARVSSSGVRRSASNSPVGEVFAHAPSRQRQPQAALRAHARIRRELPTEFNEAIGRYKCGSGSFRLNVALSALPDFRAAPGTSRSRTTRAASCSARRSPTWTARGTTLRRTA